MDDREIEEALRTLAELKSAVRRNQPMLRELASPRGFAPLALGFGILVIAFCLTAHFLIAAYGSFESVPAEWRAALWGALGAMAAFGFVAKIVVVVRRSRKIDASMRALDLIGGWFASILHIVLPMAIVWASSIALFTLIGHPWYIASAFAIVFGFVINALAKEVGFSPYYFLGYWSLATGCASAFAIEAAPFLWVAAMYGGMFVAFAAMEIFTRPKGARSGGGT
jgi:hypothetical protein